MKDTLALWKQFEDGKYDICLSQVTLDEVGECHEPKKTVLYNISVRFVIRNLKSQRKHSKLPPRKDAEEQIERLRASRQ